MSPVSGHFILLCLASCSFTSAWTPIIVKNVTALGPQLTPDVPHISRDGGYSVLLNGNSVWLYDDTECTDSMDNQLSFVSNTAAYQNNTKDVSTVTDFGIVNLGTDKDGKPKVGILADTTVGTGGWIPFSHDELDFNKQTIGKERVAICRHSSKKYHVCTSLISHLQGRALLLLRSVPSQRFSTRHWCTSITNLKTHPKSIKHVA